MDIPEDYDNDAEKVMIRLLLLSKPKETVVVPPEGLKVLAKALGVPGQDHGRQKRSIPLMTPAKAGQRSVLDDMKFGPGNRRYWEMEEGRVKSRYPDLIRALSKEQDPSRRRLLFESHRRKIEGMVGNHKRKIEQGGTSVSRQ